MKKPCYDDSSFHIARWNCYAFPPRDLVTSGLRFVKMMGITVGIGLLVRHEGERGMSNQQFLLRMFAAVCLILIWGMSIGAHATTSTFTWKEEVLLHDGNKIIVERSDIYDSGMPHVIGQGPPLAEHSTTFMIPGSNQTVVWKSDNRSRSDPDNFHLLVLDFLDGVPYVATKPAGARAYAKWNRPNPPYVFFKYVGEWKRIALDEFPDRFNINIIVTGRKKDNPRISAANRKCGYVPTETVAEINREPGRSMELYSIIRVPLDHWKPRPEHKGPKAPFPIPPPTTTDGTK